MLIRDGELVPSVEVQPKSAFRSKTWLVNALVILLTVIAGLQEVLPPFDDILNLPDSFFRWLLLLTAVGNMALRIYSDTPARINPAEPVQLERFVAEPLHGEN